MQERCCGHLFLSRESDVISMRHLAFCIVAWPRAAFLALEGHSASLTCRPKTLC